MGCGASTADTDAGRPTPLAQETPRHAGDCTGRALRGDTAAGTLRPGHAERIAATRTFERMPHSDASPTPPPSSRRLHTGTDATWTPRGKRHAPCVHLDDLEAFTTLSTLPKADTTLVGVEECVLCLEVYDTGDEMRTLGCAHFFHRHCIDTWLRRAGTCPVCCQTLQTSHVLCTHDSVVDLRTLASKAAAAAAAGGAASPRLMCQDATPGADEA